MENKNKMIENLKDGDILICKRKSGFIAKLIRWATKSEWSHTAMFFRLNGVPMIIEAQATGIDLKTYSNWEKKYNYEYRIMRKLDNINYQNRAFSKIGVTGYDFISFIIRQPWRLITGNFKNKGKTEEKRMICSEYTAWVYSLPEWWKSLPGAQYKYLKNHKDWIEIKS